MGLRDLVKEKQKLIEEKKELRPKPELWKIVRPEYLSKCRILESKIQQLSTQMDPMIRAYIRKYPDLSPQELAELIRKEEGIE